MYARTHARSHTCALTHPWTNTHTHARTHTHTQITDVDSKIAACNDRRQEKEDAMKALERQLVEVCVCIRYFGLGYVWIRLDTFGYVWIRCFGYVYVLDTFYILLGYDLYRC